MNWFFSFFKYEIKSIPRRLLIFVAFGILYNLIFVDSAKADFFSFLDPVANFKQGMREWFSEMATSFATAAFEYMGLFIIAQTDISQIPSINTLIQWSQMVGGSLLTFFFLKRVIEGLRDNLTGESEPNYAEIIGSTVVAAVLVFATPTIVKLFIKINNLVVSGITSLGINVDIAGHEVLDKFTGTGDLALASIHVIFMTLIWALAFFVFSVVGAMRYVELGIVLIMGCISATTYANRSSVYQTYWTEALAIIFTQCVHIVLAYWIIQWSSAGTFWGLIASLASSLIALRGPQVLRQFIYSSGTGGALSGGGRLAAYKMMMPKYGK